MTPEELAAYCLAKPGAQHDEPWEGDPVAKVGGKIFAFLGSGITVKCGADADGAAELRLRYPDSVAVSPYIGRFGWNRVELDGAIPDDELRELVDASYDAVVAKLPKAKLPKAKRPNAKLPKAKLPKAKLPKAKLPKAKLPKSKGTAL